MLKQLLTLNAVFSVQLFVFGVPASLDDYQDYNSIDEINSNEVENPQQVAAILPYDEPSGTKEFFIVTNEKVNWFAAQQHCSLYGSTLASLSSLTEAAQLQQYLFNRGFNEESFWTSGNNLSGLGIWFWMSTGKALTFSNFVSNNPRYIGLPGRCLEVTRNGKWKALNCFAKRYFICQNRCPLSSFDVPLYPGFRK